MPPKIKDRLIGVGLLPSGLVFVALSSAIRIPYCHPMHLQMSSFPVQIRRPQYQAHIPCRKFVPSFSWLLSRPGYFHSLLRSRSSVHRGMLLSSRLSNRGPTEAPRLVSHCLDPIRRLLSSEQVTRRRLLGITATPPTDCSCPSSVIHA